MGCYSTEKCEACIKVYAAFQLLAPELIYGEVVGVLVLRFLLENHCETPPLLM